MSTKVRVLVIAGDPLARAGLAALLGSQPEVIVAGLAATDDDLAAAVTVHRPEVLLWDWGWNSDAALAALVALAPFLEGAGALPVAVLLADQTHVRAAWAAGARGVLRRDAGSERIAVALGALAQHIAVIAPDFVAALIGEMEPPGDAGQPLVEPLTPRELEVLRLMAEGLPNKGIAQQLEISEHTVKFHVNAILGKLGVESRTEAVVRATRLGLILL
jgi:DNA-binding NarL/FixJ family response regulator